MFNLKTKTSDYMSIMVTHECNRKCAFCVDSFRGRNEFIDDESLINALIFAHKKGIKDILIVGGEPTLHPYILDIVRKVKDYGFNLIFTTNCDKPDLLYQLDEYVDSFNFSYYNQEMPNPNMFHHADLTISALIFKGQLDSKQKLDNFIDRYENDFFLKFSTLTDCNEFTKLVQKVTYLNDLPNCKYTTLFDEIMGQLYRGHIIKRYDLVINDSAEQSYKCHTNGTINQDWSTDKE